MTEVFERRTKWAVKEEERTDVCRTNSKARRLITTGTSIQKDCQGPEKTNGGLGLQR